MSLEGAIAANRFGLGARPGEIERASANPKKWLLAQVNGPADQPTASDGQPFANAGQLVGEAEAYKAEKVMIKQSGQKSKNGKHTAQPVGGNIRKEQYVDEMSARFALGFSTERPFAERIVRFWSNHFTVSAQKREARIYIGAFEREAIRPHINGSF